MHETFGELLKRHRTAAGFSQEQLAELAGVSTDAISLLERGLRRAPQKATLNLLLATLALNDSERIEIEEAARLARGRGPSHGENLPSNLPPRLTSFVDREQERSEIKALLHSHRLVTVVGTGGAGKTRCAIEIAAEMLDDFGDGVWLAELAPISDPGLVSAAIARALRVQQAPDRSIGEKLLAYLKRKRLLLIFDNCEHVLDEVRRVATEILVHCPDVRILATSRENLAITGEQVYRMPSLPVPAISALPSADEMSQYGAMQLFSDRAVAADSRFALTIESAPHVAEICRRLDGIPLAIELAAARVKVLSPRDLARRLDERFRVLTGGDRAAFPRHRTMRALIDWSYDLLSDDERALFRTLAIFRGIFTLKNVAMVYSEDAGEVAVFDLLSSLIDKSLVQTETTGGDTAYRLLESTREYAREKLSSAGEQDAAARRHARAFLASAEQFRDEWDTTPDGVWLAQTGRQLENFRAALDWAFGASGDALLGQRLTCALRRVWHSFSPAEGRRWVHIAQQRVMPDTPVAILAALDLDEADLASSLGQYKASLRVAEQALARNRELDEPHGNALAKLYAGRAKVFLGNIVQGEALLEQALDSFRAQGAVKSVVSTLGFLAIARKNAGDLRGARERLRQALANARAVGADRTAAIFLLSLAEAEFRDGNPDEALRLANEAAVAFASFGDDRHFAGVRYNMAAYLIALRRYDEARTAAREAITPARDAQFSVGLAFTLQHLAAVAALREKSDASLIEDRRRAAQILGYVDARLSALEASRQYTEQQEYDIMLPALRETLGADVVAQFTTEGFTWTEDRAVAEAMLI